MLRPINPVIGIRATALFCNPVIRIYSCPNTLSGVSDEWVQKIHARSACCRLLSHAAPCPRLLNPLVAHYCNSLAN
jgi:hypothetical protein